MTIDLTTLDQIKIIDKAYKNGQQDASLTLHIKSVSSRVEKFLGRTVEIGSYTQLFNIHRQKTTYAVKAYPVTAVSAFKNLTEVSDPNPCIVDLRWVSFADNELGNIGLNDWTLTQGYGSVQIDYTGGMATDTADFSAKFPDIEHVVVAQILFEMQQARDFINRGSDIGDQESERRDWNFLPMVKQVLTMYKRKAFIG